MYRIRRASFVWRSSCMPVMVRPGRPRATDEFLTFVSGATVSRHRYTRDAMRILVVEDEKKVAKAVREGLEAERYDVHVASTGEEGFFLVNHEAFDLVVLDLMLPRRDGLEVLTTLRKRGLQTPVLILTARDTVDDRVHGLDSGADDYLVKPFAFPELLARIRALLRRDRSEHSLKLQQGDLEMDVVTRRVRRAGQAVELTVKEFEVLEYLLRHRECVVSREMLSRDVWQVTARATPLDNVIDVTIARLRRKIDDRFGHKLLHTVRGVGFVLGGERR
jgi:two-component system, OmpR family, copper resistance phosphate regulon response regulator CusR